MLNELKNNGGVRMRWMEIELNKYVFRPGETIQGRLIVECTESFEFNDIHVTLQGKEHTRIERSDGEDTTVYRSNVEHVSERILFDVERVMPKGKKIFTFQFKLPNNLPFSYHGKHGWIEYGLAAKIEISWAFDVQAFKKIQLLKPTRRLRPNQIEAADADYEHSVLEVTVPRDIVYPDKKLHIKVRVSNEVEMRKLRAELISREKVVAQGREEELDTYHCHIFVEDGDIVRQSWIDIVVPTSSNIPAPFHSSLITVDVLLKVTIDIPFRFDKSIFIPLQVQESAISISEDTDDGLDWLLGPNNSSM